MVSLKMVLGVERTECSNLRGLKRMDGEHVRIPEEVTWEKIRVRPYASLSISTKYEDKLQIFTATLKFFTCQNLINGKLYAYRLKLIDGSFKLIGSDERPYPVMTIQENMPDKPTENQWNEVQVTWTTNSRIPQIES